MILFQIQWYFHDLEEDPDFNDFSRAVRGNPDNVNQPLRESYFGLGYLSTLHRRCTNVSIFHNMYVTLYERYETTVL